MASDAWCFWASLGGTGSGGSDSSFQNSSPVDLANECHEPSPHSLVLRFMAGWMICGPQTSKRSVAFAGKAARCRGDDSKRLKPVAFYTAAEERGFRPSLAAYRHGSALDPAGGCSITIPSPPISPPCSPRKPRKRLSEKIHTVTRLPFINLCKPCTVYRLRSGHPGESHHSNVQRSKLMLVTWSSLCTKCTRTCSCCGPP